MNSNLLKHSFFQHSDLSNVTFTDSASLIACDYDIVFYRKALFKETGIPLPTVIHNAATKRQAEYIAGRYVAKKAIKTLGIEVDEILIGNNRAPIWPSNVVASITHTNKTAVCVAASTQQINYLGIDLENILSAQLAKDLVPYIINNQEQQLLHNLSIPFEKALTIIFSAKESVFKALYPQVKRYFDFTAVQITTLCTETKLLSMILTEDLSLQLPKGMPITGRYLQYHDQIFTYIIKCQEEG